MTFNSRRNKLVAQIHASARNDRSLAIQETAEEVGISYGSCQIILTEDLVWLPSFFHNDNTGAETKLLTCEYANIGENFLKNIMT
jgi:hypothetical protein